MMAKSIQLIVLFSLLTLLIGCEPIRITTKVKPFDIEPPEDTSITKKLPLEAIVLIDEQQTKLSEYTDWDAGVTYEVDFPAGNLLKQLTPLFFNKRFKSVKNYKYLSPPLSSDSLVINASVNTINFVKKCCPESLDMNVHTEFRIFDHNLIYIALPIISRGDAKMTKPGFFAYIDDKDYAKTAYQAMYDSVKKASDKIYEAIINPKGEIINAKQIINKDPSNITAYKVIANLSLKNKDFAEALAASQMIVQLNPQDIDGHILLYESYLTQRKFKEAKDQLEKAISLDSKNGRLISKLFNLYIQRGKKDKAKETLEKFIELNSEDLNAKLQLAILNFNEGKHDEVIRISESALQKITLFGIGARILKNEGEYAKIKSVEPDSPAEKAGLKPNYEIIEIDGIPTLGMSLNDVIQKLRGKEGTVVKLSVRKENSEDSIKYNITRSKFYVNPIAASFKSLIALAYLERNDMNKAAENLYEAENISAYDEYLKFAKILTYLKQGQYENVLIETKSLRVNHYTRILEAIALANMKRFNEAINSYKKAESHLLITEKLRKEFFFALKPYLDGIENKAYEFERAGKLSQALKEYGKIIELSSPEKAQWIRSRVARIISQNPSIVDLKDEARRHFLHAEVLYSNNKFEDAIAELDAATSFQPFNPQIYFNKALVYEKIGDYAKAIENMEAFLQLSPSTPNAQAVKDQIYKWRFILEKEI